MTVSPPPGLFRANPSGGTLANPLAPYLTLAEKEKEYVLEILEATGQNASRATEILDTDRRTLYRILERHGSRVLITKVDVIQKIQFPEEW